MNTKSITEYEEQGLNRLSRLQLPHVAKKVGWVIFILGFVGIFLTTKDSSPKLISKYAMLIGLLMASLSKERVEDELMKRLRLQSYSFAFILAVFITITHPLFSYVANVIFEREHLLLNGVGDWLIMWLLLSAQVFYFEFTKWMHT